MLVSDARNKSFDSKKDLGHDLFDVGAKQVVTSTKINAAEAMANTPNAKMKTKWLGMTNFIQFGKWIENIDSRLVSNLFLFCFIFFTKVYV